MERDVSNITKADIPKLLNIIKLSKKLLKQKNLRPEHKEWAELNIIKAENTISMLEVGGSI